MPRYNYCSYIHSYTVPNQLSYLASWISKVVSLAELGALPEGVVERLRMFLTE